MTGERTPLRYAKVSRWPPRRLKDTIFHLGLTEMEEKFLFMLHMEVMLEDRWPTMEMMCKAMKRPPEWVEAKIAALLSLRLLGLRSDGAVYLLDFPKMVAAAQRAQRLRKHFVAGK